MTPLAAVQVHSADLRHMQDVQDKLGVRGHMVFASFLMEYAEDGRFEFTSMHLAALSLNPDMVDYLVSEEGLHVDYSGMCGPSGEKATALTALGLLLLGHATRPERVLMRKGGVAGVAATGTATIATYNALLRHGAAVESISSACDVGLIMSMNDEPGPPGLLASPGLLRALTDNIHSMAFSDGDMHKGASQLLPATYLAMARFAIDEDTADKGLQERITENLNVCKPIWDAATGPCIGPHIENLLRRRYEHLREDEREALDYMLRACNVPESAGDLLRLVAERRDSATLQVRCTGASCCPHEDRLKNASVSWT